MKVVKLTIDENAELEGIDAVALVEEPAIEIDFQTFSKEYFQSFNDYPKAAIEAAKQGIKRNEALKNKCGTAVGKRRATQLANGENISLDTIKRMRSFLLRQKDNYDLAVRRKDYDACGYISYLLWGGAPALPWAEKKLRQAGLLEAANEEIIREEMKQDSFSDIRMIEGIPVFQDANDALEVSKMIGCDGVHEHEIEGAIYYMPCQTHDEAIDKKLRDLNSDKYFSDLSHEEQDLLLKALDKTGKTAESMLEDGWVEMSEDSFHNHLYFAIVSDPEKGSLQDTSMFKVLYQYSKTPFDSKNRDFCRRLISLTRNKDLLFRLEDINNMSLSGENQEFGTYDIFTYKGSYNCRHSWNQKFYRKETDVEKAKRSAKTNTSWEDVLGGPRAQQGAQVNPKSRTQAEVEAGVPEGQFEFSAVKDEQRVLLGPLMVADKLIPRIDENGDKYYVFFDEEAIRKLSYKMMTNKLIDSVNIEHDPERTVDDVSLVESWLVDDPEMDKAKKYGYNLTKGSWMAKYKVNNDKVWDEYVKTGKVKGFSIEGIFNNKIIMQHAN